MSGDTASEYLVAHEMVHLVERGHSAAFWKRVVPDYVDQRLGTDTQYHIHIEQATGLAIGDGARVEAPPHDRPLGSEERPGASAWNTAAIRDLLTAAFNDEVLTTLCFDHFRPVYEGFGTGMSKVQKVQRLLDYCDRHGQFDTLLRAVETSNPTQYACFEPRLRVTPSQPRSAPDL